MSRGGILSLYAVLHLLVDGCCAALVLSCPQFYEESSSFYFGLIVCYNFLAFALQPLIGWLCDRWKNSGHFVVVGVLLVLLSLVALHLWPLALGCVCLAGIGNACFHIGAGSRVLNLYCGRATEIGMFVAPGAVGLVLGGLCAKMWAPGLYCLYGALLIAAIPLALIKLESTTVSRQSPKEAKGVRFFLVLNALLFVIAVRALLGLELEFPWKTNAWLLAALTTAVFLGKFGGGYLADKLGWQKVGSCSLVAAAPLLSFYSERPILALIGVLLLNATMPVTMAAVVKIYPERVAYAFGLNCLAMFVGSLCAFYGWYVAWVRTPLVLVVLGVAAIMLYVTANPKQLERLPK